MMARALQQGHDSWNRRIGTGRPGWDNRIRKAMTAHSEKDIWNMTMDVTMDQDCPDRVSLDRLNQHVSLDMTGWPGHDSIEDRSYEEKNDGAGQLGQDSCSRIIRTGQPGQEN